MATSLVKNIADISFFVSTYSLIFWSRKVFEGVKTGPNLPFLNNLSHVKEMFAKGKFGPDFFSESGPNLPFRTILIWTKLAF